MSPHPAFCDLLSRHSQISSGGVGDLAAFDVVSEREGGHVSDPVGAT